MRATGAGTILEGGSLVKRKPKAKWDGQPFLIGRYQLGFRMVSLWAETTNGGGWFNLCKDQAEAQIHVGMDYKDLGFAFQVLCHEVWEMACDEKGCVFEPKSAFVSSASDCVWFAYNHSQHTEICAHASFFLLSCVDDFRAAYRKVKQWSKSHGSR